MGIICFVFDMYVWDTYYYTCLNSNGEKAVEHSYLNIWGEFSTGNMDGI